MTDYKRILTITFLPIFVLGLIFFWLFVRVNSAGEEINESVLPLSIKGIVIQKEIDEKNHATKSVLVQEGKKTIILYDEYWPSIYKNTSVGDSIFKRKGSIRLFVSDKNDDKKGIQYKPARLYFHKRNWMKKLDEK